MPSAHLDHLVEGVGFAEDEPRRGWGFRLSLSSYYDRRAQFVPSPVPTLWPIRISRPSSGLLPICSAETTSSPNTEKSSFPSPSCAAWIAFLSRRRPRCSQRKPNARSLG